MLSAYARTNFLSILGLQTLTIASSPSLGRMIRRLAMHSPLSEGDQKALENLSTKESFFEPSSFVIREGDRPADLFILVSGFCIRHKISKDGYRQIVGVSIPGDIINIHNLLLDESDYNVQMLARSVFLTVSSMDVRSLLESRPAVGAALLSVILIESSIYREWLLNNGRRDSRTRIGHLLCELSVRLDSGIDSGTAYDLPMTQEQLGDAVGITAVHVNRSLKSLARDGLIEQIGRRVVFPDWSRLKDEVGFNARYLHARRPPRGTS